MSKLSNSEVANVRQPRSSDELMPVSDVEETIDEPSPSEFFKDGIFTDQTIKHIMPPAVEDNSAAWLLDFTAIFLSRYCEARGVPFYRN